MWSKYEFKWVCPFTRAMSVALALWLNCSVSVSSSIKRGWWQPLPLMELFWWLHENTHEVVTDVYDNSINMSCCYDHQQILPAQGSHHLEMLFYESIFLSQIVNEERPVALFQMCYASLGTRPLHLWTILPASPSAPSLEHQLLAGGDDVYSFLYLQSGRMPSL